MRPCALRPQTGQITHLSHEEGLAGGAGSVVRVRRGPVIAEAQVLCPQPSKKKRRAQVIEFLIDVARECFNIGNFNSLMAIVCECALPEVGGVQAGVLLCAEGECQRGRIPCARGPGTVPKLRQAQPP